MSDEMLSIDSFDEEFYLQTYPDVAVAVKGGEFTSGLHHFRNYGISENRIAKKTSDIRNSKTMMRFCSLGFNCEFGIAQRHFGADPIDLLRWAGTPTDVLIRLLQNGFEHIGDPAEIDVLSDKEGEFFIYHKRYNFVWHAFANSKTSTAEAIKKREVARLPFLAGKLMKELTAGERLFIVKLDGKQRHTPMDILNLIHGYGRGTLVYVDEGGPVEVRRESEYLFHATVSKFAEPTSVDLTTLSDEWLDVCEGTLAMREVSARPAIQ